MNSRILFFLMCSITLLTACKKHSDDGGCNDNLLGTKSLTLEEKLIHPYGMNDSLVFLNDSLQDQISFSCTEYQSLFGCRDSKHYFEPWYKGCFGDYYKVEYVETYFNQRSLDQISLVELAPDPYDTLYTKNGLDIEIRFTGPSDIDYFQGRYAFNKDTLFNYPYCNYARIDSFYDKITISNKLYHKVYLLEGSLNSQGGEVFNKVYYSVSDGILRFSTNRGNVWDLKEKFIRH